MKALVHTRYGPPDLLQIKEVPIPVPKDDEVLIKVHATTVNRTDCANIRAKPFFMRLVTGLFTPKKKIPGTEFAGEIVEVGKDITTFNTGERVFGFDDEGASAHAEYLAIQEDHIITIPENTSFIQAAASTEGFHYAYNFINKVDLKEGDYVLVNGATGAIGSAAVQLLSSYGVHVTAVCAKENMELVRSLGAKRVIDYTSEDFTKDDQRYEFVFDMVGKSSFFKCFDLLKPRGVYISSDLGYLAQNMFLPFFTPIIKPLLDNKITAFPYPSDIKRSLVLVKKLIEEGKFTPLIDSEYPFDEIIDAYSYVEKGHKKGNVVITMTEEKT